jgi:hypothetical protein
MTKSAYIESVIVKMNEAGRMSGITEIFAGSDTTNAISLAEQSYMSAWRKSVGILPRSYFRQKMLTESGGRHYYSRREGTGCVSLPEDFYVLSSFRMRGWEKSVYTAIEETEDKTQIQSNVYIRGNYELPVCTLTSYSPLYEGMSREGSGRMLRYYSLPPGMPHQIEFGYYIALPEDIKEKSDEAELSEKSMLYEPLSWIHAGVVFSILGKGDQAKVCDTRALETVF